MSPSLSNALHIMIGVDRIRLVKLGRGLRPRQLTKHEDVIASGGTSNSWLTALERLDALLGQQEWQNAEVSVVLSNRLVRYAVVPFDAQLKDKAAQEAFARYTLTHIYGPAAAQWEMLVQAGKSSSTRLVATVEKALLQQVRQVCASHKLRLSSVTPSLMQVFNRHQKGIKPDVSWLVVNEPGYSLFALLRNREFVAINGVCHDSVGDVPLLLDRENLSSPLSEPCKVVYLHTPFAAEASAIKRAVGYEFNILEDKGGDAAPQQRNALLSLLGNVTSAPLQFDFHGRHETRRLAGWMLFLTGIALMAEMGLSYGKLHREHEAILSEARGAKLRLDLPSEGAMHQKFSGEDIAKARQIVSRLSTPWEEFFAGLEAVNNKNAAILSIEPDVQSGTLRIRGEAKDYASVLTLVSQLRGTKPFSEVFLAHHEVKRDDPQHPVDFTLSLRWGKSA